MEFRKPGSRAIASSDGACPRPSSIISRARCRRIFSARRVADLRAGRASVRRRWSPEIVAKDFSSSRRRSSRTCGEGSVAIDRRKPCSAAIRGAAGRKTVSAPGRSRVPSRASATRASEKKRQKDLSSGAIDELDVVGLALVQQQHLVSRHMMLDAIDDVARGAARDPFHREAAAGFVRSVLPREAVQDSDRRVLRPGLCASMQRPSLAKLNRGRRPPVWRPVRLRPPVLSSDRGLNPFHAAPDPSRGRAPGGTRRRRPAPPCVARPVSSSRRGKRWPRSEQRAEGNYLAQFPPTRNRSSQPPAGGRRPRQEPRGYPPGNLGISSSRSQPSRLVINSYVSISNTVRLDELRAVVSWFCTAARSDCTSRPSIQTTLALAAVANSAKILSSALFPIPPGPCTYSTVKDRVRASAAATAR